jgi:hypothetical protein
MDLQQVDRVRRLMGFAGRDWTLPAEIKKTEAKEANHQARIKKRRADGCREYARLKAEEAAFHQKRKYNSMNKGLGGIAARRELRWQGELMKRYRPLAQLIADRNHLQAVMVPGRWYRVHELKALGAAGRYWRGDVKWMVDHGLALEKMINIETGAPPIRIRDGARVFCRTDKPAMVYEPKGHQQIGLYRAQALAASRGAEKPSGEAPDGLDDVLG